MTYCETEKNRINKDFSKLKKVALSCLTKKHLKTCMEMYKLFNLKYNNKIIYNENKFLHFYLSGQIIGIIQSTVNKLTVK